MSAAYWRPAVTFLNRQDDTQNRVEAVATWGHWEAYYLARAGFPLARGWFRQDDFPENRVLYDRNLTAAEYDHWPRLLGVRFVVLPDTTLDYSSVAEARLLRSGHSGLRLVSRSAHLSIYELPDSVPIVSAPAGAHAWLIWLGPPASTSLPRSRAAIWCAALHALLGGAWWVGACVSRGPDGMTEVRTPAAGLIALGLFTLGEDGRRRRHRRVLGLPPRRLLTHPGRRRQGRMAGPRRGRNAEHGRGYR